MSFVRGESSDTATKGDKYMWKETAHQSTMMRGLKRGKDEDDYFDEDEPQSNVDTAAVDDDDPLEAYMRELEGKPAAKKPKPAPTAMPPPKPAAHPGRGPMPPPEPLPPPWGQALPAPPHEPSQKATGMKEAAHRRTLPPHQPPPPPPLHDKAMDPFPRQNARNQRAHS